MSGSNLEFNKLSAAILTSILILIAASKATGIFYHDNEQPEKRGYSIEVLEVAATGSAPVETGPFDITTILASADIAKGEKQIKACAACHSFEKGGKNKVGPNLWNIVDKPKGTGDGFAYSKALMAQAAEGGTWNYQSLSEFLRKPKEYMPGTKMAYAGIKKPEKRADLIMYLRSLSDNPAEIPAAPAATVPAEDVVIPTTEGQAAETPAAE